MRFTILLTAVFAVLLAPAVSAGSGFNLTWDYYSVNGIDDVYVFDLDSDGVVEVYGCSYDISRPTLWVLNNEGGLLYDILIPRPGLVDYGNEKVMLLYPTDLDGDGVLDIMSATQIITTAINSHRLYRLERGFEKDLNRYRTRMSWMYERIGFVTAIAVLDAVNETNGTREIYTSSGDFKIRSFDVEGNLLRNISLDGSIWDIHPVVFGNGSVGFIVGSFQRLYLLDRNLEVLWEYHSAGRFSEVYASDVDNDSVTDIFAVSDNILNRFTLNGTLVWSKLIGGLKTNVYSADFDGDGVEEIILGAGQKILGMNPDGDLLWEVELGENPNSVYASDLLDDGNTSLIVASTRGLKVFDFKVPVNKTLGAYINANTLLVFAKEYYERGNYSLALEYATEAKKAFTEIGEVESIVECGELIEKTDLTASAEQYRKKALEQFDKELYHEAMNYTLLSIELYSKLGFIEDVNELVSLNETIFHSLYGAANVSLGNSFYAEAESYYVYSRFELAAEYAGNASMYYGLAGDASGVSKADALLESALGKMEEYSTTTRPRAATTTTLPEGEDYSTLAVVGFIVLTLVLLFFFRRR